MSSPHKRISPSMRAGVLSSCIRLMARRKVDLPQPLGPMMAVTARAAISSETFLTAVFLPKMTDRLRTVRAGPVADLASGAVVGIGLVGWGIGVSDFGLEAVAREEAHADVDAKHKQKQYQRGRPGLPVPVVVRRFCVFVNLQWH